ncbi:hypothetical protein JR316_0006197 [Psilocybe cubensis]|uniref:Uncharacterized protein n=2 Tax=Psilocybe cubensis TaxID=181762 RepID=A0A8H7Y0P2_PSICU|nr:hypothetical protein JR316_0006197 [Psilocybe cubensis]KAH9481670.1 hypothetical protein JR316_0006197 [Psilocybe cubensis]
MDEVESISPDSHHNDKREFKDNERHHPHARNHVKSKQQPLLQGQSEEQGKQGGDSSDEEKRDQYRDLDQRNLYQQDRSQDQDRGVLASTQKLHEEEWMIQLEQDEIYPDREERISSEEMSGLDNLQVELERAERSREEVEESLKHRETYESSCQQFGQSQAWSIVAETFGLGRNIPNFVLNWYSTDLDEKRESIMKLMKHYCSSTPEPTVLQAFVQGVTGVPGAEDDDYHALLQRLPLVTDYWCSATQMYDCLRYLVSGKVTRDGPLSDAGTTESLQVSFGDVLPLSTSTQQRLLARRRLVTASFQSKHKKIGYRVVFSHGPHHIPIAPWFLLSKPKAGDIITHRVPDGSSIHNAQL